MILDKTWFIEMIVNGIPVSNNIDIASVFNFVEEMSQKGEYRVAIFGNELAILDDNDNINTTVRLIDDSKAGQSLAFFIPEEETELLAAAKSVGGVVFATVIACNSLGMLDETRFPQLGLILKPMVDNIEENFKSDFV